MELTVNKPQRGYTRRLSMYLQEMLVPIIHMQIWLASKGTDRWVKQASEQSSEARQAGAKLMYNTKCYHARHGYRSQ